ncbi:hypothetical protein CRG98_043303 [Punica granatum]|uniref:Uncharacterized protein n=1 Tax=Punica granatum TaxID=22663 RepID=A0A2I0HX50_PUNGR|nr:hypothetical protein CRG98_043303 [Punica granatum]
MVKTRGSQLSLSLGGFSGRASGAMVNKKRANSLLTLPKKELQTLCRKYGMPSYKPKPYLAEALAALLPDNFDLKALKRKCANTSCSQSVEHDPSSLDLNVLPRITGKKYLGKMVNAASKLPAESAYIESVRSVEVSTPSFEFHVRSEGGINLYVDLNSTLSEWAESLKKNICITENSNCRKSQRLHEELGRFGESTSPSKGSIAVTANETDVEHLLSGTAANSENKQNSCKEFDCLDRVDGSLTSSIEVSHTMDEGLSKPIEENSIFISPKSSSSTQNQIPVSTSSDDQKIDIIGDSLSNSISDGAVSFLTSEQPLKVITEQRRTSPVRYDSCSYLGSTMHGCSAFASVEKQLSEAAGFQKDKSSQCKGSGDGLVDHNCIVASEQGESANSSEVDHGSERSQLLICPEKEARSSTASEMEILKCSQFEKSFKRNSLIFDDFVSSSNFPKRQSTNGGEGNGSSNPEVRNLRRHLSGEVLPRQSMRS